MDDQWNSTLDENGLRGGAFPAIAPPHTERIEVLTVAQITTGWQQKTPELALIKLPLTLCGGPRRATRARIHSTINAS